MEIHHQEYKYIGLDEEKKVNESCLKIENTNKNTQENGKKKITKC